MNVFERMIQYISKYFDDINTFEQKINNDNNSPKKKPAPERYREFSLNTYF